jgi:ABC-2 type transport system permease protein
VTELLTTSDASYAKPAGLDITTYDRERGDVSGPFALAVAVTAGEGDGEARIVWLSSSLALDDDINTSVSGANYDFFMNSLGWLAGQAESVSIRAKSMEEARLTVPSGAAARMSLIIVGALPLGLLATGIYIFARRKRL